MKIYFEPTLDLSYDFDSKKKEDAEKNTNFAIIEEPRDREYEYEEALKKIGVGKVHWILLFSSGLTLMTAMNELVGMGIIAIASQCEFKLTSANKGLLTSASLAGNILCSYFWGYISDTRGRRPVLISTQLATNFFSLVTMFVPNFWVFIVLRFCMGVSISGATSVTYAYLGEFFSARYRPVVINYASLFVAFAILYVPAVAWLVLMSDWSLQITESFVFRPWRILMPLYILPGFISALLLFILPESPKILLALQKPQEAYNALNWVYKTNVPGHNIDDLGIYKLKPEEGSANLSDNDTERKIPCLNILRKMWRETIPLFKRPLVGNFIICCFVMCSTYMISVGLGVWFPEIQNRLSTDMKHSQTHPTCYIIEKSLASKKNSSLIQHCDDTISKQTFIDSLTYGAICMIGYIVLGGMINLLGRKNILVAFLSIAGLCGIALIWILEPIGIVLSFSLFLVLSELCMSITNGVVVDLTPTHLCGQAVCICLLLGRLSSIFAIDFVGIMLENHCTTTFLVFGLYSLFCGLLSVFLPK